MTTLTNHFNLIQNCLFSIQNRIFVVDGIWNCGGQISKVEFTEVETEKHFTRSGKYIESLIKSGEIEYRGLRKETKPEEA